MVRSTLSRTKVFSLFTLFACTTPLGIILGQYVHNLLGTHAMVVAKALGLSIASGVFLYLSERCFLCGALSSKEFISFLNQFSK